MKIQRNPPNSNSHYFLLATEGRKKQNLHFAGSPLPLTPANISNPHETWPPEKTSNHLPFCRYFFFLFCQELCSHNADTKGKEALRFLPDELWRKLSIDSRNDLINQSKWSVWYSSAKLLLSEVSIYFRGAIDTLSLPWTTYDPPLHLTSLLWPDLGETRWAKIDDFEQT